MRAAGDGDESALVQVGEQRCPGCEFVGVVGDDEGAWGEEAGVPGFGSVFG